PRQLPHLLRLVGKAGREIVQVRRGAALPPRLVLGQDEVGGSRPRAPQLGEGLEVGLDLRLAALLPLAAEVDLDHLDQGGPPGRRAASSPIGSSSPEDLSQQRRPGPASAGRGKEGLPRVRPGPRAIIAHPPPEASSFRSASPWQGRSPSLTPLSRAPILNRD